MELTFTAGTSTGASGTCDVFGTSCSFPTGTGLPTYEPFPGLSWLELPDHSEFTLTLVKPPTSGQLLVDPDAMPVLHGYTDSGDLSSATPAGSLGLALPTAYRPVGVALTGKGAKDGATFELCPVHGRVCTDADTPVEATTDAKGRATFDGRYLPGTYSVTQTSAPEGQDFDPAPQDLVVDPTTTVEERDTITRLTVPMSASSPTTTPPATTSPATTAPAPATTPATEAPGTETTPQAAASSVAEQTLAKGAEQTVVLGGFQPHEMVHGVLHSTPVDLGTVEADAEGVATFTFTIPAGLETGSHSVTMTGLTSGITSEATFTVTAAATAGNSDGLAYTGTDVLPLLAVGGGLLAAGAAAVTVAARRRSA
jgi:hypothetical protein